MTEQAAVMDEIKTIQIYKEFYDHYYHTDLLEAIRKGLGFLVVDFRELARFNIDLANTLLEKPEDVLAMANLAATDYADEKSAKKVYVRFMNLPRTQSVAVSDIRSKHLNTFVQVEGMVRQKSDVRPKMTSSRFECPGCGNVLNVLQLDRKMKEPVKCGCGRKGKFRMVSKEMVDAQSMTVEESAEDVEGGAQPKRMKLLLQRDLVSPFSDRRSSPGTRVAVTGVLKEMPIFLRSGAQATNFDIYLEVNHLVPLKEEFTSLTFTKEDEDEIRELAASDDLLRQLVRSVAPNIYGHDEIKEALLYQMTGGVRKEREAGAPVRGDIHVLLMGDPGAAKSQMLKRICMVSPKSRYVAGRGTSGIGLTAAVVKDEFLQGFSLEAGALVLANKGLVTIDEFDKIPKEDKQAIHEAMEQQTISIAKANIQATLKAQTSILAAANPKHGRFDPYGTIAEQIDLPSTLINRFDLLFPVKDVPDEKNDDKLADFILDIHCGNCQEGPEVSTELLRKYIAYAKQHINPVVTNGARQHLKEYYLKMRGKTSGEGIKTIPITARQLEGLIRLSEASAKLRLSKFVERIDAERAIALTDYCLKQVAFDLETGQVDIDRISTGVSSSFRSAVRVIRDAIDDISNKIGNLIPVTEIVDAVADKGVSESKVDEVLERMKREGDLMEPRHGFVQLLN